MPNDPLVVSIIFIALSGQPSAATAQADTPTTTPTTSPDCKPATLISTLGTIKSVNNPQKDMDALLKLEDAIKAQDAACNGLFFKGTGQKSVGPVTLDSGTYLLHLVTKGYYVATLKVLTGDCSSSSSALGLYFVTEGQASDGADATIDSNGCSIIILPSEVTASWTLAITKIG